MFRKKKRTFGTKKAPFKLHDKQKEALEYLKNNKNLVEYLLIGGSRCLASFTPIDVYENGQIINKEISKIKGKYNVVNSDKGMSIAGKSLYVGNKECVQVILEDDRRVVVSKEHMFYEYKTGWKEIRNIKKGSRIACTLFKKRRFIEQLTFFFSLHKRIKEARITEDFIKVEGDYENAPCFDVSRSEIDQIIEQARKTPCIAGFRNVEDVEFEEKIEKEVAKVIREDNIYYEKIVEIREVGSLPCYTLQVPFDGCYTSNGILNKNSGKTFFGIHLLIVRALMYPKSRHIVVRLRFSHAKTSLWLDTIPKVLFAMGLHEKVDYKKNRSDFFLLFNNGSEVWIDGLDNAERVEKMLGREYNTIYYNEISQIPYDTVTTVQSRLALKAFSEKYGSCRNYSLYDANPPTKKHWSYYLWFLGKDPGEIDKRDLPERRKKTLGYIRMNPHDNLENVGENYIQLLENLPERKRKRFLEGEYSDVEGQIYENWQIVKEIPKEVRETGQVTLGGDFGFSVDVACVLRLYYVRKPFGRGEIWIEQLIYERQLTNIKLAEKLYYALKSKDKRIAYEETNKEIAYDDFRNYSSLETPIMCYMDSRDPKSIVEMQEFIKEFTDNILVVPGLAGPDTVRVGIDWLQNMKLYFTEDSVEAITEVETYEYMKDREGQPTNEPVKDDDHAMDSLRYGCTPYINRKSSSVISIGAG